MSPRSLPALALAAICLAACGDSAPPRPPPTPHAASRPSAAAATADAPPGAKLEPEWVYSSAGKRDPFRSFLAESAATTNALATRCGSPLGRYEVDQLRLVAVVTGLEDPVAMVEAPTGRGFSVRRGVCMGKNGGVVSAIRTGEVIVSEYVTRADGTRDQTQTVLRLPKQAEFNPEDAP